MKDEQPCILVSACILGENCKFNGKNNYSARAVAYLAGGAALAAWATEIGSAPPARAMPTTAANVAARLASFLGIIAPMRRSGRSRGRVFV